MADRYLPRSIKKSNSSYSRLFKTNRKLSRFKVDSVSVLEQILNRLEGKREILISSEILEHYEAFEKIFLESDKLKALAFLFGNLTLDEDSRYNLEVKSGIVGIIEGISENIEKFSIAFANKERLTEVKI